MYTNTTESKISKSQSRLGFGVQLTIKSIKTKSFDIWVQNNLILFWLFIFFLSRKYTTSSPAVMRFSIFLLFLRANSGKIKSEIYFGMYPYSCNKMDDFWIFSNRNFWKFIKYKILKVQNVFFSIL